MMQQAQQEYEKRVKRAHLAREIIEVVLLVGIIIFVIQLGIKSYSGNTGGMMSPAIQDNQLVIVSKLSYVFGSPQRGDVIIYNDPLNTQQQRIQRIIGIPGDTVTVTISSISVNGHVLKEPYITVAPGHNENQSPFVVTLGKDQYFVANDNRTLCDSSVPVNCTNDSRNPVAMGVNPSQANVKSLDRQYIIGKVVFVYWPLQQIHGVDTYSNTFAGL
jgi:signal peptidase I